jgi:Tfp pilus assembly protein PilV
MTMIEVLFTIGILAIGMVGVAAIFPAAAKLQDDASNEIEAEQVARNAEAIIKARGIHVNQIGADPQWNQTQATNTASDNAPFQWTGACSSCFSMRDRSYPSSLYQRTATTACKQTSQCDFFWVPLVRDADPRLGRSEPQAAVFVLHYAQAPAPATLTGSQVNNSGSDPTANVSNDPQHFEPQVTLTASTPFSGINSNPQVGDLTLCGPAPLGALQFQWTYNSNTPTYSTNGQSLAEVDVDSSSDFPVSNGLTNRDYPGAYASGLFSASVPYVQVYSGTPGVIYRVILVSGDLLLEK